MSEPYDANMIAIAQEIAKENNIKVSTGIYAGLTGPTLETPAEYSYVRSIGADAVGMSTVPEVIVARHMEIPCFAISIITDLGVPGKIHKVSLQDVIDVANRQEPKMTLIMRELITRI
jgi:purine-nucleoside phosphorylase